MTGTPASRETYRARLQLADRERGVDAALGKHPDQRSGTQREHRLVVCVSAGAQIHRNLLCPPQHRPDDRLLERGARHEKSDRSSRPQPHDDADECELEVAEVGDREHRTARIRNIRDTGEQSSDPQGAEEHPRYPEASPVEHAFKGTSYRPLC
jgi:hypothetical protein